MRVCLQFRACVPLHVHACVRAGGRVCMQAGPVCGDRKPYVRVYLCTICAKPLALGVQNCG